MGGNHTGSDREKAKKQRTSRNMPDKNRPSHGKLQPEPIVKTPSKEQINEKGKESTGNGVNTGNQIKTIAKQSTKKNNSVESISKSIVNNASPGKQIKDITKQPTRKDKSVESVTKSPTKKRVSIVKETEQIKETQKPETSSMGKKKMGARNQNVIETKEAEFTKHGKKKMMPTRAKKDLQPVIEQVPQLQEKAQPPNFRDLYMDDPKSTVKQKKNEVRLGQIDANVRAIIEKDKQLNSLQKNVSKTHSQETGNNSGGSDHNKKDAKWVEARPVLQQKISSSAGIKNADDVEYLLSKLRQPKQKSTPNAATTKNAVNQKVPEIVIPKNDISERSSIFGNEPSQSVADEPLDSGLYPKDIKLKSPATSSKVHLNSQSNQNTRESEEYRKINIIWDRSILMKTLKEMGMVDKFKLIHALIFKVDNALKKYIKIKNDADPMIQVPPLFKHCETARSNHFDRTNFKRAINLEADLLIFLVAENKKNNILASAAPCQMNNQNRVFVGRLYLNLNYLEFEYGSYYEQKSEIMTVFHEVLHILAFHPMIHSNLYEEVRRNDFNQKFLNLHKLRFLPMNPLIQEGHWDPVYFGNDLMAPIERIDSALSIFTLEYLDYVSPQIKTDRSVLPNNFIFDEINDFEDFFTYKCTFAEPKAKYSAFCSPQEARKGEFSCDRSRVYKTVCGKKQLSNNCYSKDSNRKYICSNPFMPKDKYKTFEQYGEHSRCFDTIIGGSKHHSLCLEFEVNDVGVLIKSEGSQYQCTGKGQLVSMKTKKSNKTFMVEVICPDPKEFQKLFELTNCKHNCYGNGFCSNGKCECFDGFDSADNCKKKTVSSSSTRFTAAL